jgi:hypothetical protein
MFRWGNSSFALAPRFLPNSPPPFRLKRLEIFRSVIKEAPFRWLLSGGSSETLTYLEISHINPKWDTFLNISKLRAEGLLPNISHLTYSLSNSGKSEKYYNQNASTPLALWNGLTSIYIYGKDAKAQAAIIHGISHLSPPPRVEMGVGDMRMVEFKALFQLGEGKLQPGTELRLILKQPTNSRGARGAYFSWDEDAESYWGEMEEEAKEVADKHGVKVEISKMSLYEMMLA